MLINDSHLKYQKQTSFVFFFFHCQYLMLFVFTNFFMVYFGPFIYLTVVRMNFLKGNYYHIVLLPALKIFQYLPLASRIKFRFFLSFQIHRVLMLFLKSQLCFLPFFYMNEHVHINAQTLFLTLSHRWSLLFREFFLYFIKTKLKLYCKNFLEPEDFFYAPTSSCAFFLCSGLKPRHWS